MFGLFKKKKPPTTTEPVNQTPPEPTVSAAANGTQTKPTPLTRSTNLQSPSATSQPTQPDANQNTAPEQTPAPQISLETELTQKYNAKVSSKDFDQMHPQRGYHGPKPVVLLVLDGWGIGPDNAGNAIMRAQTPNMDQFALSFPHTQLEASGTSVGLPEGEDGNTETGHLNIGAGTIIYQDLPRINASIADGGFFENGAMVRACEHVKQHQAKLHVMGLVGGGEVHASVEHLYAILELAKQQQVEQVFIHAFTDGRDSPPKSGIDHLQNLQRKCDEIGIGTVASITGRYYAMDRDQKWDRIQASYINLTEGTGKQFPDHQTAMKEWYQQNITDEFIEPSLIVPEGQTPVTINDNDAIIFFNYRIDRPRELTKSFVLADFEHHTQSNSHDDAPDPYSQQTSSDEVTTFSRTKKINNLYFVTMTRYEKNLPTDVAFPPQIIGNPICKVFADFGLRQLRMAETEKERFVTYYMNGQSMDQYPGERRIIVPSKGKKSYDQVPKMSAKEIADLMLEQLEANNTDVVICNFANADMVGHTGNLEATIQACEFLDEQVGRIVSKVYELGGVVFITADHGNAEEMINNENGGIDTEHSIYPVPLLIIGPQFANNPMQLPTGILADVAPTMLSVMGIPRPESMTGRVLL